MSDQVEVYRLPNCEFCSGAGKTTRAVYDGKTKQGPWANMCDLHFYRFGVGLGTGKGQRLVLREEARDGQDERLYCTYDTGVLDGGEPTCTALATYVITYRNGSYGPFKAPVCDDHVRPMQGRAYPGVISTEAVQ